MADYKFIVANGYTGGTDGYLDAIDGDLLADGDVALVVLSSGQTSKHILDADSGLTEDTTNFTVIAPDTNAGTKRWIRVWQGGRVLIPDSTIDQGAAGVTGTLAWHIANASGEECDVKIFQGDHDVTTNIEVPVTMVLKPEKGAILDGSGDLQINSAFGVDIFYQVFGTSITVTFKIGGTTEIHPEWWGTIPNGASSIHTVLNKAIAATNSIDSTNGTQDPTLILRPGTYYTDHSSISTISCNVDGPKATFAATANVSATGYLLQFDYTENARKQFVNLDEIIGPNVANWDSDEAQYNVGINVIGGDSCDMTISRISSFAVGWQSAGTVHEEHVGMWNVDIDTIIACNTGLYVTSGTTGGTDAGFEAMNFNIRYVNRTGIQGGVVLDFDSNHANAKTINGNVVRIGFFELHTWADMLGLMVRGENTFTNKFIVDGQLIPPTGTGKIVVIQNSALENIFETCYMDWDLVTHSGGYNIFRQTSNQNAYYPALFTNDYGRSEIRKSAAPTEYPWRVGDMCWNSAPSAGGTLGWVCTTSGTPGTWNVFGSIAA